MERKTMKASQVIAAMQSMIDQYGDRDVFFSDGFFRYGMTCGAESAPNFDSPKAFLVAPFDLKTGINGLRKPLEM